VALLNIRVYPDPVLKKEAEPVSEVDDDVRQVLADMVETMYAAGGVGLAAPQVGISRRMVVIDISDPEDAAERRLLRLVNPEIVERQGKIVWEEGCLSLPGVVAEVERSSKVVAHALDPDGNPIEISAEGLMAVAIQHELDHLDGILFIDRLSRLRRKFILKDFEKVRAEQQRNTRNH